MAPDTGNQGAPAAQTVPAARFSPGVADIVKMVDAKVDPEVIKAYIQNSPTAYNPSVTEIIALKDKGVGPEILTAMLQHGAEVRAQSMRAAQAAQGATAQQPPPGAANPYAPAPAPAYDYSTQPVYPNYAYSYPDYSYAYPVYSSGYSWPYYWPSFSFGLGCYPYGGYCGYRYPYYCGGHGYGNYYGNHGYYGGGHYGGAYYRGAHYGGREYYGYGARSVSNMGRVSGSRSFSAAGRSATFASTSGGFRAAGGFGGRSMGRSRR